MASERKLEQLVRQALKGSKTLYVATSQADHIKWYKVTLTGESWVHNNPSYGCYSIENTATVMAHYYSNRRSLEINQLTKCFYDAPSYKYYLNYWDMYKGWMKQ